MNLETRARNREVKKIGDTELTVIRKLNEDSKNPNVLPLVVAGDSEVFVLYNPIQDPDFPYVLNTGPKKALKKLARIKNGIPKLRFVRETQKTGECIIEYPNGTLLSNHNSFFEEVPDNFFDDLSSLLKKIHSKGVANIGINNPANILITRYYYKPYLLGFEGSICKNGFFGWLYDLAEKSDWYSLWKLKQEFRPEQLVSDEIRELEGGLKHNSPLKRLQKQFRLEQLISNGKKESNDNPLLYYASYLIESILENYAGAEEVLRG